MTIQPFEIIGNLFIPPMWGDVPEVPRLITPCPLVRADRDDIVAASPDDWFGPDAPDVARRQADLLTILGRLEDGLPAQIQHTSWCFSPTYPYGTAMFSLHQLCMAAIEPSVGHGPSGGYGAWVG